MANELHSHQILSNGVKPISFEAGHDIYHQLWYKLDDKLM